MKGKNRGLGWYVGMVFGDPVAMADPDAPGQPPGGSWWTYVLMWAVIGLILGVIPALALWRIYWVDTQPPGPPPRGATAAFDGTYIGMESRVIGDRKIIGRCSSGGPPGRLTISDGVVHIPGYRFITEVQIDGSIRLATGSSLYVLRADLRGTVQGTDETRDCTYHLLWKKE